MSVIGRSGSSKGWHTVKWLPHDLLCCTCRKCTGVCSVWMSAVSVLYHGWHLLGSIHESWYVYIHDASASLVIPVPSTSGFVASHSWQSTCGEHYGMWTFTIWKADGQTLYHSSIPHTYGLSHTTGDMATPRNNGWPSWVRGYGACRDCMPCHILSNITMRN